MAAGQTRGHAVFPAGRRRHFRPHRASDGRPPPGTGIPRIASVAFLSELERPNLRKHGPTPPRQATLLSDPYRCKGPLFVAPLYASDGMNKMGKIEPPISAIRVRKPGPVNWHGAVRDFRGDNGGIMVNQRRARRPSFRALIKAIFPARFPRSRWPGDVAPKKGKIEPSLAAIIARK